jgi:tetratricopeptide (TPR) repeat protein
LSEALAVPGGEDSELRWIGEALYAMNMATALTATETPEASFERLRSSGAKLDEVDLDAHPLTGLLRAAVAFFAEDRERSERYVAEALDSGNDWVVASVLMFRANMAENRGDVEATRADVTAALAEFRRLGERWGTASSLRGMAQLLTLDGDLDGAMAAYEEALRLMSEMNSRDDEAFLRTRMADLCLRGGDQAGARAQIRLAQASNDSTGSALESVFTLCMLAEVERQAGDLTVARALHGQALQRMEAIPPAHPIMGHSVAIVLAISTRLAICDGELDSATEHARKAYAAALGTKDQPIIASMGVVLAALALALDDPVRAARMLGAAAGLRGAEDRTDEDIRQLFRELESALGAEEFAGAYQDGRVLDYEAAVRLLDPS